MLKWFIIGTLLYYAVLLWRYRDSLGTWFTDRKKQPEQPESKPTVKAENGDCLVGASRYRMGQMRTNGDILGHLSKGVDNASIFVPQSDEAVEETPDNKQGKRLLNYILCIRFFSGMHSIVSASQFPYTNLSQGCH